MQSKNCPNCGAPYDVSLNKCPYCGTSYFDMSAIDINGQEPFYLKLKYYDSVITAKVVAEPTSYINLTSDVVYAENPKTGEITSFHHGYNMDVNITFRSVADSEKLFTLEKMC